MANSELRYNIVYQIRGEQDLQKSINLVNSLTGDAKLLTQEIDKNSNANNKQRKALQANAAQTERYIRAQQKLRSDLPRTSAEYARLTDSINKGTRSVRQIDQVLQKNNRTTRANLRTYETTTQKLRGLSLQYRELQSGYRSGSINEEQARKRAEELAIGLSAAEIAVQDLGKKAGISAVQMEKLRQVLVQTRNSSVSATRSVNGISDAFVGTTKVSSSANQLLLSFGDIAQDSAQFSFGFAQGARAIGNNIAFASEQILILTQKMEANKKGSATLKGVFKELGSQLAGPVGIIVGINVAITAITMLAQRQERLKKKTEDATSAFKEQAQALLSATQSLGIGDEFAFFDVTGAGMALSSLTNMDQVINDLESSLNKFRTQAIASNATIVGTGSFVAHSSKAFERYQNDIDNTENSISILKNEQKILNDKFPILANLSEGARKELIKLSDEYRIQNELQETARKQIQLTALGGQEYINTIDEIKRITNELSIAESERALGIETTRMTQDQARAALETLTQSLRSGAMSPELYANAVKLLSDAMSGLKKETEGTNDALERQQRNMMAGLDIDLLLAERAGGFAGIREARLAILNQRIIDEELTANEIKLSRMEIDFEYFDALENMERESALRRQEIQRSFAQSSEQINRQLVASIQGTFQALIPNSKVAAIMSLAIEKALAIGKVISDSQASVNALEVEATALDAKAIAAGVQALVNPAMALEASAFGAAAKATRAGIPVVKAMAKKNIAKIAAIGLFQGAATIAGGGGGGARGGGGGGGGGGAGAGAGSRGADSRSFGATFTDVDQRPQFVPRDGSAMASGAISVQILADRKQLYALVRQGEEEYSQIISS